MAIMVVFIYYIYYLIPNKNNINKYGRCDQRYLKHKNIQRKFRHLQERINREGLLHRGGGGKRSLRHSKEGSLEGVRSVTCAEDHQEAEEPGLCKDVPRGRNSQEANSPQHHANIRVFRGQEEFLHNYRILRGGRTFRQGSGERFFQ